MLDTDPENEVPFLSKNHETTLIAHRDYQSGRATRRLIVTVALVSALISAAGTVIMHSLLPIFSIASSRSSQRQGLLPSLNLPPLGNLLRTYVGDQRAYYDKDLNVSREAWMSLFPRMLLVL